MPALGLDLLLRLLLLPRPLGTAEAVASLPHDPRARGSRVLPGSVLHSRGGGLATEDSYTYVSWPGRLREGVGRLVGGLTPANVLLCLYACCCGLALVACPWPAGVAVELGSLE